MSELGLVQGLTLVAILINTVVAAGAFVRAGKWRSSDDGRKLQGQIALLEARATAAENAVANDEGGTIKADIHKIKNEITKIDIRLSSAEKVGDKVLEMSGRVTSIETTLQHMASRADIEAVKAEIGGVQRTARNTEAAVARIEGFLMERAG